MRIESPMTLLPHGGLISKAQRYHNLESFSKRILTRLYTARKLSGRIPKYYSCVLHVRVLKLLFRYGLPIDSYIARTHYEDLVSAFRRDATIPSRRMSDPTLSRLPHLSLNQNPRRAGLPPDITKLVGLNVLPGDAFKWGSIGGYYQV